MKIKYLLITFLGIFCFSFFCAQTVLATPCVRCDCGPSNGTGGIGNCLATCEADEECQGDATSGDGIESGSCVNPSSITICSAGENSTFEEVVEAVFNFIFWLGMAIFPLMCVIAGVLFMISGGNPQKIESAKKLIFVAIIGLVLFVSAKAITALVRSIIGL